jgi:hypothetical protein
MVAVLWSGNRNRPPLNQRISRLHRNRLFLRSAFDNLKDAGTSPGILA